MLCDYNIKSGNSVGLEEFAEVLDEDDHALDTLHDSSTTLTNATQQACLLQYFCIRTSDPIIIAPIAEIILILYIQQGVKE